MRKNKSFFVLIFLFFILSFFQNNSFSNFKEIDYNNLINNFEKYDYNPAYPTKKIDFSSSYTNSYTFKSKEVKNYKKLNEDIYTDENRYSTIKFLDHALDKDRFLNYYKKINVNFYFNANVGSRINDWNETKKSRNINFTLKTEFLQSDWSIIWESSYANENNNIGETAWKKWNTNSGKVITRIQAKISSNKIEFRFKNNFYFNAEWGHWIWNYTESKINSIELVSNFKLPDLQNAVTNSLKKGFSFDSDSSPLFDSTEKNGISFDKDSNKEIVEKTITNLLKGKNGFGDEYDAWFDKPREILTVNINYEQQLAGYVTVTLKDRQQISGSEQFVQSVKVPVKIKLTELYYQRSVQKRFVVTPGIVVNPSNSNNELIDDKPEYDLTKNSFVYHNSVYVTFTALKSAEILTVNGNEVPVYNNVYNIKLDDMSEEQTGTDYAIVVKGIETSGGETTLKINLTVKSYIGSMSFKWLGWNPEIYEDQYNLVNQTDKNGNVSKTYDPTINAKTGMRNEFIFVQKDEDKYSFAQDPVDIYGNLIKDNSGENQVKGYIAEAMVANSGVTLLQNVDKSNISRILRVEVDSETLEEIDGSEEDVTTEMVTGKQWSMQGLYHYVIYLKDHVTQQVDLANPPKVSVNATEGSTIHKFVYISQEEKDYASFSSLEFINDNIVVNNFWLTSPGKHLKGYLINHVNLNSDQISDLTYERLITYWKLYVSEVYLGKIGVDVVATTYVDIQTLFFNTVKMNTNSKEEAILKIKEQVTKVIVKNKNATGAKYNSDFIVTDKNDVELSKIDMNSFLEKVSGSSSLKLKVKALPTSSLIFDSKEKETDNGVPFQVFNLKDYDENKVLDLSLIEETTREYNFTSAGDDVKEAFVNNYIFEYTKKLLIVNDKNNLDFVLYEDYYFIIDIEGIKYTISKNEDLSEEFYSTVNSFLNAETTITMKIRVVSVDLSIKTVNSTMYTLINNPDSDIIAPIAPPDPEGPNSSALIAEKSSRMWLIPVILIGSLGVGFGGYIIYLKKFRKPGR